MVPQPGLSSAMLRGMDSDAVASVLDDRGIAHGAIAPAQQGWSYFTFEVAPDWIFRFPRNAAIAAALQREIAVLPEIAARLSVRVPRFVHIGEHRGWPFVGYRRIEGRALSPADLQGAATDAVALALCELHAVPLEVVAPHVAVEPTPQAWRQRYNALHAAARQHVVPLLAPPLATALERAFARFLDGQLAALSRVTPVHYDLGCEHLLVDPQTGRLSGIIDFEEISVGDPAVDFVGLWVSCGAAAVQTVLARYTGPRDPSFEERIQFYACMGAYHEIEHGLQQRDRGHVEAGMAGLARRLLGPRV